MHIAIVGAGISGLLTALELIEHGCSVEIFDQQQAGQAASWGRWRDSLPDVPMALSTKCQ